MDINCTYNCAHQHEGKCYLNDLPAGGNIEFSEDVDCLYFSRPTSSRI